MIMVKKVFKDINLKINKGEIVGIFGPSGSGKTTFINLCLGLIKPTDGEIIIDNKFDLFENSSFLAQNSRICTTKNFYEE